MNIEEQFQAINQNLKTKGFKLTSQREATVRVLLENEKDHLSAEDVYMLLKRSSPDIGLATVYRTLELLSELHIVEKVNFGDGATRFDLRNSDQAHHHHHLICTQCGTVEEIKDDWLMPLETRLQSEYGFTVLDHRLDFQGICQSCKSKARENVV